MLSHANKVFVLATSPILQSSFEDSRKNRFIFQYTSPFEFFQNSIELVNYNFLLITFS